MATPRKGCGHCGFAGPLEEKASLEAERDDEVVDGRYRMSWLYLWALYRCPSCGEPTLTADWWSPEVYEGEDWVRTAVYPTRRNNEALPENVRERYDAALRVRKTDPGFYAVGIGRMLEAVCRDQGKTEGDLYDRLEELVSDGVLPASIGELAHQIRSLRNFGAHDNDFDVEKRDVPAIEDFAEVILEYLYRAPAQLDTLRTSVEERKQAAKSAKSDTSES